MKKVLTFLAIFISFICGILLQNFRSLSVFAQAPVYSIDTKTKIIRSNGSATSSKKTEEAQLFQIFIENNPQSVLTVIPKGKKLVITDMMFDARYTDTDLVINLAQRIEDKDSVNYKKHNPLQQISIKAGESKEIHFCTGYVIESGNGIVAWTNAGLPLQKLVLMNFTGYLADETTQD